MQKICGVTLYCPRGQCTLILLAACRELGGSPSKSECLDFIDNRRWFNKDLGQDLSRYPGNSVNEPRWKTLFAWARNQAADHNCITRGDDGYWPISGSGKEELEGQKVFLRGNDLRLRLMFLATPTFKKYVLPEYQPSNDDLPRPPSIYEDCGGYMAHNIRSLLIMHSV